MNITPRCLTMLIFFSGTVYAQVPPTNDTSDQFNNTGSGTGALSSSGVNTACPIGEPLLTSSKCYNTALGYDALGLNSIGGNYNTGVGFVVLYQNSAGYYNTASGAGALEQNTTGNNNTAFGFGALSSNILGDNNGVSATGSSNTAIGSQSLYLNTTGSSNTASGFSAMYSNTTGVGNVASGWSALYFNTTGTENSAFGSGALYSNTSGNFNTASGSNALAANTSGINNTATGVDSLSYNTIGNDNTATGYGALNNNVSGSSNTASGEFASANNTTGFNNTAAGYKALVVNTTGGNNSAFGYGALYSNTTGSNNIAVGVNSGSKLTSGGNNIDIGNMGTASDTGAIKIGTLGTQTEVFIAGINNSKITGSAVYVTPTGRLGVLASSERYKTGIKTMGSTSEKLKELRPVTFKLGTDVDGVVQYGLIAEEVAKVYPELVLRDDSGKIEGVRYEELAPMLLNEIQKQGMTIAALAEERKTDATRVREQSAKIQQQAAQIDLLERRDAKVKELESRLDTIVEKLENGRQLVVQR